MTGFVQTSAALGDKVPSVVHSECKVGLLQPLDRLRRAQPALVGMT